jgi:hypothetical protein
MVVLVVEVILEIHGGSGNTPSTAPSQGNNGGTVFGVLIWFWRRRRCWSSRSKWNLVVLVVMVEMVQLLQ